MRHFEFKDSSSQEFWSIDVQENEIIVTFGKIGTQGQKMKKRTDSDETAKIESEKLIKQKIDSGYIEVKSQFMKTTSNNQESKQLMKLMNSENLRDDLFQYLKPIFTQEPKCEGYLNRLIENVQNVKVNDGGLEFTSLDKQGEEFTVTLNPPFKGKIGEIIPRSMAEFCKAHNGVSWTDYLGAAFYGLNDTGRGIKEGGWDPSYLKEADEDNKDFLDQLKSNGYEVGDIDGPIDYGQNWIFLNPADLNDIGEPMVYFLSHGDCEAVEVKAARKLKWGPIVLRVMLEKLMGDTDFTEIYD